MHAHRLLILSTLAAGLLAGEPPATATAPARYAQDFTGADKPPEELMVLSGEFTVAKEGDNAVLELAATPLETYNLLFGPTAKDGVAASARIKGTANRRQGPTFGVGLGGVSGHLLQVAGTKKQIELVRDGTVLASAAFEWTSDAWVRMQIRIRATGPGAWVVEGRAWPDGTPPPAEWTVSVAEKEEPINGRASVWGVPYGGKPIRYDDLVVEPIGKP